MTNKQSSSETLVSENVKTTVSFTKYVRNSLRSSATVLLHCAQWHVLSNYLGMYEFIRSLVFRLADTQGREEIGQGLASNYKKISRN